MATENSFLEDLLKQFADIHGQAERSEFFHANPELAAFFGAIHFPKQSAVKPVAVEQSTKK